VVNFVHDNRLASVVTAAVGNGPLNIVINGMPLEQITTLVIESDSIILNGNAHPVLPGMRYFSGLQIERGIPSALPGHLATCREHLLRQAHPASLVFLLDEQRLTHFTTGFQQTLATHFQESTRELFDGDFLTGVHRISGCGPGLTPAGDDLLAGFFAARHLLAAVQGQPADDSLRSARQAARSKNLIADSALRMAAKGCFTARVKHLMHALIDGKQRDIRSATDDVLQQGSTSGADWLTGFIMTLQHAHEKIIAQLI
jgi:hypothetical protein